LIFDLSFSLEDFNVLYLMAQEIILPKLGETMEEAVVVACKVKVGDEVHRGDVILDIETDKAAMEFESPESGFVKSILFEVGQTVPVGAALLVLGQKDEQLPPGYKPAAPKPPVRTSTVQTSPLSRPAPAAGQSDYNLGQKIPATSLQKDIARKMLQSKREIPCFYLNVRVDVTDLVEFRANLNQNSETKVSFNDLIIFAMARALKQFPTMTGQLAGDYIQLAKSIGIGLAIAMPDGYVAPVIKDVDKKTIRQIASDSKVLIEKAKGAKLSPSDFEGGCTTLSNLGAFGVESFIPVVIPGQCTILGAGKIIDTCVPLNSGPTARKLMKLTLAVDHKVANGAYAAQFLEYIKKLLEDTTAFS
jgi:pyruvate dehydrogenase E2 component (dihydrolipoamide acetyltransferase)